LLDMYPRERIYLKITPHQRREENVNRLWWAFLFTLVVGLAVAAAASPSSTARPEFVASHPQVGDRPLAIPFWIRNVGRRFVIRKIRIGEIPRKVGEEGLKEWLRSGAKQCASYLPAPYFCPRRQAIWSRWGVGYALSWNGRVPGAWTSPTSPRRIVKAMRVGVAYWLTCWTRGDRVSDGGIVTNLWYRLPSGSYVNDGWFETGTNSVIPGVGHC
jgi:hypothetical protein